MNTTLSFLRSAAVAPVALACLWLSACGGSTAAEPTPDSTGGEAEALDGRWQSACVPQDGERSMRLDFDFEASTWGLDYRAFSDPSCSAPFMTVHIEGPYEVGGPSAVRGAREARFGFSAKSITPHTDAAVGYLSSLGSCGDGSFAVDSAEDVGVAGCVALGQRPIADCGQDYDLVAIEGDTLHFGERPADNDMCSAERRPTAISGLGMTRVR